MECKNICESFQQQAHLKIFNESFCNGLIWWEHGITPHVYLHVCSHWFWVIPPGLHLSLMQDVQDWAVYTLTMLSYFQKPFHFGGCLLSSYWVKTMMISFKMISYPEKIGAHCLHVLVRSAFCFLTGYSSFLCWNLSPEEEKACS